MLDFAVLVQVKIRETALKKSYEARFYCYGISFRETLAGKNIWFALCMLYAEVLLKNA